MPAASAQSTGVRSGLGTVPSYAVTGFNGAQSVSAAGGFGAGAAGATGAGSIGGTAFDRWGWGNFGVGGLACPSCEGLNIHRQGYLWTYGNPAPFH